MYADNSEHLREHPFNLKIEECSSTLIMLYFHCVKKCGNFKNLSRIEHAAKIGQCSYQILYFIDDRANLGKILLCI